MKKQESKKITLSARILAGVLALVLLLGSVVSVLMYVIM